MITEVGMTIRIEGIKNIPSHIHEIANIMEQQLDVGRLAKNDSTA